MGRSEGGMRQLQTVRVELELRPVQCGQVRVRVFARVRTQIRKGMVSKRRVGWVREEKERVHVSERGGVCGGGTCESSRHVEGACGCDDWDERVQREVFEGLFVFGVHVCQ